MHMFTYVFVTPSILQSYFTEEGFKKTENFKHSVVLLFLFILEISHVCVYIYVFVVPSIFQSQFIEKGFKKTKNFEHSVVLLLFLFTLDKSCHF